MAGKHGRRRRSLLVLGGLLLLVVATGVWPGARPRGAA